MENRKIKTHKVKNNKKENWDEKNILVVQRPGRKDVPLATYN